MSVDSKTLSAKMAVVELSLDKEWNKASKASFLYDDNGPLEAFRDAYGDYVYQVAKNLVRANYKRYGRVRDKVAELISNGNAYFLTLTFKDEVLSKTSEATRRRYVSRVLKANFPFYVANIDYGDKNGREHYHAIVWSFLDPLNADCPFKWPYGFFKSEHIGTSEEDSVKTCKYVTKLTRHALKASGMAKRLIYSRN